MTEQYKFSPGATSKTIEVFIGTSGLAGISGLTSASVGLICYYHRQGANASAAITLSGGTLGTWGAGGQFVEVDATHMTGSYQLSLPDAALASGADWVRIMLQGFATMVPTIVNIDLTTYDANVTKALGTAVTTTTAGVLDVATTSTSNNATADAFLDRSNAIETGITPRLAIRYSASALCGVLSGAGGATITIQGIGVGTTRNTATVDANGNRTGITLT